MIPKMKFNFKTLQYQSDAVESIINIFNGQPFCNDVKYIRDVGNQSDIQTVIDPDTGIPFTDVFTAYRNEVIHLSHGKILENIREIQFKNNVPKSKEIVNPLGMVTLDIEMETGTGKTYVYTKTIFELNRKYGWSKFIIVVPSIAIREGVKKSIEITQDHFNEIYNKKIRPFIYDSSKLYEIDAFSQSPDIAVMIINSQAFNAYKKGKRNKESRIIYSIRDEFESRCPVEVIAANHPIIIQDEPQKLGKQAQEALEKYFNVLFSMNFSATPVESHNLIYSLDPLDAFNMKLVKKIIIKGIEINHKTGSEKYIYFEGVEVTKSGPKFRLEIDVNRTSGIKRERHILSKKDNIYEESNHIESYKGLFIDDYFKDENAILFSDGTLIHAGESIGDTTEANKRRIQIRETIKSHLDRENRLFKLGIKVLSLFFIDEVAKYRIYENGIAIKGEYANIFEEEFNSIIKEQSAFYDSEYIAYLTQTEVGKIHSGYFSIDKEGHMIDSIADEKSGESDDVSAYDLILKNKERLLSFDEPVRFIFSHSALSEGWDNPNVFQICALKHSFSNVRRRQEVGRGLRICVNQSGNRQDYDSLGPRFHDVNSLTVIADEDYQSFVKGLQDDFVNDTRARPVTITADILKNKAIIIEGGEYFLDSGDAKILYRYLIKNDYIGIDDLPTEKLKEAIDAGKLDLLPPNFTGKEEGIFRLLKKLACPKSIKDICEDGRKPKVISNDLNQNFCKKEFLEIWNEINHVYHYKVSFDSEELIRNAVKNINSNLNITAISGTVTTIEQKSETTYEDIINKSGFNKTQSRVENIERTFNSVKYDLIGRITSNTGLTRKTISKILYEINNRQFDQFKLNPEEFIEKISKLINEEKSSIIVNHIEYSMTDEKFDSNIFTMNRPEGDFDKAYRAVKNVQDYVFTDSKVEREFAEALDGAQEVVVYAKLPDGKGGFCIPTPMGDYTPDWAIAFQKGTVRHIYFVAETKGSMISLEISRIQQAKIDCVKRLFDNVGIKVGFGKVASYSDLLTAVRGE